MGHPQLLWATGGNMQLADPYPLRVRGVTFVLQANCPATSKPNPTETMCRFRAAFKMTIILHIHWNFSIQAESGHLKRIIQVHFLNKGLINQKIFNLYMQNFPARYTILLLQSSEKNIHRVQLLTKSNEINHVTRVLRYLDKQLVRKFY